MKRFKFGHMTRAAVIAALYAALSLISFPVNGFLLRPAEALTVLPCLSSAAIPGLMLGCLLSNYIMGCLPPDILFGALATLLGAVGTFLLRRHRILSLLPPIAANALILPPVWIFLCDTPTVYPLLFMSTLAGELLCCGLLGDLLRKGLEKHPYILRQLS